VWHFQRGVWRESQTAIEDFDGVRRDWARENESVATADNCVNFIDDLWHESSMKIVDFGCGLWDWATEVAAFRFTTSLQQKESFATLKRQHLLINVAKMIFWQHFRKWMLPLISINEFYQHFSEKCCNRPLFATFAEWCEKSHFSQRLLSVAKCLTFRNVWTNVAQHSTNEDTLANKKL
jgi:hypothetical protein